MRRRLINLVLFICMSVVGACATPHPQTSDSATIALDAKTQAFLSIGDEMLEAGDLGAALGFFERARLSAPDSAAPHLKIAAVMEAYGRTEDAVQSYQKALSIAPDDPEAHITYARYLMDANPEKALLEWEKAADRFKTARIYNWLGINYDLAGAHDAAQNAYKNGLLIDKDNLSLQNNLGLSYAVQGKGAQARSVFNAIIQDDNSLFYLKNAALAHLVLGDKDTARSLLSKDLTSVEINTLFGDYKRIDRMTSIEILRKINGL